MHSMLEMLLQDVLKYNVEGFRFARTRYTVQDLCSRLLGNDHYSIVFENYLFWFVTEAN